MFFSYENCSRCFTNAVNFTDAIKIRVFEWYIWYVSTNLEMKYHFYFILNAKYWSFLKFWASLQLSTTKSRFCGFSQSHQRTLILAIIHASDVKILSNLKLNQNREFLSYNDVRPSVGKLFARTLQLE